MYSPNRAAHSQDVLPGYHSGDVAARAASAPILAVRQFESQPLLTAGDDQGEWHPMAQPTMQSWTNNRASSKNSDTTREFRAPADSWLADSHGIRERAYEENARRRKSRVWLKVGAVALISIVLVVFLPVFFLVIRKNLHKNRFTGGDGSVVTLQNGTKFTYKNPFGGFWVDDPSDPFNDFARPNSWTPAINGEWRWGKNRVFGVNLGGWLVLAPVITPDIFQRYPSATDEFTLSKLMAADTVNGGLAQLEAHYNTFITEQDIAEIAGAGLNFVRVPLPFWAIETWDGEPYLEKVSWIYFLRLLGWARKYGLRVCLDLHTVPGSQNTHNHVGPNGTINFLTGNMGLANAQRTLYYIRVLTEFISQPQYRDLIPLFNVVDEPTAPLDELTSFYLKTHDMIRSITGRGPGNGPYIVIHDGFQNASAWTGFLQGSDRIVLDEHPFLDLGGLDADPVAVLGATGQPGGKWPALACSSFGQNIENNRQGFGVTIAGEFSVAPNDCGLFLNGVNSTSANPDCSTYNDWVNYNNSMKDGLLNTFQASADALGDWIFWTWKIGPSQAGTIQAPLWSYQLGLQNGWIPKDPRTAQGKCASLNVNISFFPGNFLPWQTGTPSSIPASSSTQFPWPPTSITAANVPISLLPTYTNTAPIIILPVPTFTAAPSQVTQGFNGWFNRNDTEGGAVKVTGCPYPDEYSGFFAVTPTAPCTGPTTSSIALGRR